MKPLSPEKAQSWLVNFHINAIYQQGASHQALENTEREFGTSVVPWRRPLQRLYFLLATRTITARFAAHARIEVVPSIPDSCQCVIIPGRHKIRFIDARRGAVYCHLKEGSNLEHFQHELDAREFAARHGIPVPGILDRLSDHCFVERMVVGTPLNRLALRREQINGFEHALQTMQLLYESTARLANVSSYVEEMLTRLKAILTARRTLASSSVLLTAQRLAASLHTAPDVVELVRSHGDFQAGNILYDRGDIWLIDWEYSGERQRQYDFLTYAVRVRDAKHLAARISSYATEMPEHLELWQLRLFLLETILFEAEAISASAATYVPRDFFFRLDEFERVLPVVLAATGQRRSPLPALVQKVQDPSSVKTS